MKCLLAWCNRGEPLRAGPPDRANALVRLIVPAGLEGEVIAGPLGDVRGPTGALLLVAPPACPLSDEDMDLLRALLEPFSVALENDRRLREIAALREAAEADRSSLLSRLGRRRWAIPSWAKNPACTASWSAWSWSPAPRCPC